MRIEDFSTFKEMMYTTNIIPTEYNMDELVELCRRLLAGG